MFLKVIACEIALRELYHLAARSPHLLDLEFLTQGHHDRPARGRAELQQRIDAVPAGKYDAILLGYGLCSSIAAGLTTAHTRLVIPRAHDCITFFLGSKERYRECFDAHPGTYYYTSGWLECAKRRGEPGLWGGAAQPAGTNASLQASYAHWVEKYGEDQAKYLLEELGRWTESYSHGTLIDFEFLKPLQLDEQVRQICAQRGWQYSELPGDLRLLQMLLTGDWPQAEFLTLLPGQKVEPSNDEQILRAVPL